MITKHLHLYISHSKTLMVNRRQNKTANQNVFFSMHTFTSLYLHNHRDTHTLGLFTLNTHCCEMISFILDMILPSKFTATILWELVFCWFWPVDCLLSFLFAKTKHMNQNKQRYSQIVKMLLRRQGWKHYICVNSPYLHNIL